jgi:hypothetical protein
VLLLPLLGRFAKIKEQRELRLARLRAGRFYEVTCEKGHKNQMSGIDLCRRLEKKFGEKVLCPECYDWVRVTNITDGPLMNEEQKKKQQEEYLVWEKEQKEALERRRAELRQAEAIDTL